MGKKKSEVKDHGKYETTSSYKSALKTAIKKVITEVEAGNKEAAVAAYNVAASKLDASVSKGIHHKNYASRQKSRLAKLVNSI